MFWHRAVCFAGLWLLFGTISPITARADDSRCEALNQPEKGGPPLPADLQKRVNEAIDRGVALLRQSQTETGVFGDGRIPANPPKGTTYPVAFAALPALALLECGVDPKDEAVEEAARFVRQKARSLKQTYEISLAILFLDRLGRIEDRSLIRALAVRLAAGQGRFGGWGYTCPVLQAADEANFLNKLRKLKVDRDPIFAWMIKVKAEGGKQEKMQLGSALATRGADNSNTQFAMLALWNARKHNLPLDYIFAQVQARFELSQGPDGWTYAFHGGKSYGAMTCVGLLGLAAGQAVLPKKDGPDESDRIKLGLKALASHMADPSDPGVLQSLGEKDSLNLYFLWSVERVGVLFDLKTIGGKDWYRWGVDLLLPAQKKDGSWVGRGSGGSPVIDTCFALLFLKRSDLLPDLRETLKTLKIVDPGESPKSPGEKETPEKKPSLKTPLKKISTINILSGSLNVPDGQPASGNRVTGDVSNAGTITVGSSGLAISGNVTNSGTITVSGTLNTGGASLDSSGTINFNAGGSIANDITSTGIININGASSIPGSLTTNGTMSVYAGFGVNGGGGLTNSGTMNFYGGLISTNLVTNNGTIVVQSGGTISGNLENNGTLRYVGSTALVFTVTGDYTQGAAAWVKMRLWNGVNGVGVGDRLNVNGNANLNDFGTLELTAMQALAAGQNWAVISSALGSDDFFGLLPPGGNWIAQWVPGDFYVVSN